MSANLRLFTKAIYGMDHVVRLARPGDWGNMSPCVGWTARHVLGHVNAIQRYQESLIVGTEPSMNPMNDPDRHAGDDPAATWAATRDAILEILDRPGVLDMTVNNWSGPTTVDNMIAWNVGDTTTHTWDLARALGVDDRLDPQLVAHVLVVMSPAAGQLRESGMVAAPVDVAADADAQTRMLAMLGRSA
ncbi:unannotated protein [freshwater metagenome]|uniref:Unannotated protein n=1 Tax=freshwater metagenome TaxID=449393 RepID=A0A6J7DWH9_9ZZZZ|nr:TIGR03086 family protein [Actinomycetota bacterium]